MAKTADKTLHQRHWDHGYAAGWVDGHRAALAERRPWWARLLRGRV